MSKRHDWFGTAAITFGAAAGAYLMHRNAQRRNADAILQAAGQGIVQDIANAMGCIAPPVRISRDIDNAMATSVEILVNPDFLFRAMNAVCYDPACHHDLAVGILGHEVGHVVLGHAGSPPWLKRAIELEADDFSGTAMARRRVSPDAFEAIIWQIAQHYSNGPTGYPNRYDRVATIRGAFNAENERLLVESYNAGRWAALRHFGLAA
ncbi:MAG TPA: hypothetical protein VMJ10_23350 [Kofleriaceae bacterium]|nr:hypothetical protein [Kofleriaceae bacterium]